MSTPAGITRRNVSFGSLSGIESGDDLSATIVVASTVPYLVWAGTGDALVSDPYSVQIPAGGDVVVPLIPTDLEGWTINGADVDVSDGKQSHAYDVVIQVMRGIQKVGTAITYDNLIVPSGADELDADKVATFLGPTGETISIPTQLTDAVSEAVAAAQQAASLVEQAAAPTEEFVASRIPAGGAITEALSAATAAQVQPIRDLSDETFKTNLDASFAPGGSAGNINGTDARTLFDQRLIRTVLAELAAAPDTIATGSAVTVTVGTAGQTVSQIAGAKGTASNGWPMVHYENGPYTATVSASIGYVKNAAHLPDTSFPAAAIEFVYDGDKVGVKTCNVIPGQTAYWVFVDGVAQSAAPIPITDTTGTAGALHELLLDFGSAASRHIRVILSAGYYNGLNALPIYSVTPAGSSRRRVAVIGDSWVGGANSVPEFDLWANRIGILTGWEVGNFGLGGTGYSHPGVSPKVAYGNAARTAQLLAWSPELVIVFGSLNDDDQTAADVGAAATALYADIANGLPNVPVIVIGPPRTSTAPPAARLANRDALAAAAAAAPNVIGFIDQIGGTASTPSWATGTTYKAGDLVTYNSGVVYRCMVPHTASSSNSPAPGSGIWMPVTWFVGTGNAGATNGTGPTDRLIASDATHPTSAGHAYFCRRAVNAMADTIRAYLAA